MARAFVLMPFDEEYMEVYTTLIKPVLEGAGYEVARADSSLDQRNIMRDVVSGIATADLVIADLTELNPNVLYELGLAHGMRRPVVMLTQDIESLPFDLRPYRVLTYSTDFRTVESFKNALGNVASGHKEGAVVFGSPVDDFAALGGTDTVALATSPSGAVGDRTVDGDESEQDGLGILDLSAAAEAAMATITEVGEDWAASTAMFGTKVALIAEELELLASTNVPGKAARMLRVVKRAANEMRVYADSLVEPMASFQSAWAALMESVGLLITRADAEPEDVAALEEAKDGLGTLEDTLGETAIQIGELRDTIAGLPPVSKETTQAGRKLRQALNAVVTELELGHAHLGRLRGLMTQRLEDLTP